MKPWLFFLNPMHVTKAFETKQVQVIPGDADMEQIRQFALRDLAPEDVFVGKCRVCNDQVDRSHERFPVEYLERFAATLPGKSLMRGHDYSALPLGRFFDADVVQDGGAHHLVARYFVDAQDAATVRGIELGVLRDVSIGFNAGGRECDLCGKTYDGWMSDDADACQHIAGKTYDGKTCTLTYINAEQAEAMETSLVWLGCQPGAQTVGASAPQYLRKAEHFGAASAAKENDMEIAEALAKISTLEGEKKAWTDREAQLAQQVKAAEEKAALAGDGEKYRAFLRGEITRLYGAVGKQATAEGILKHLEQANAETLETIKAEAQKEFDEKFPPAGHSHSSKGAEGGRQTGDESVWVGGF